MIKNNEYYCDGCGKKIVPGNRPDGLPNGMSFQLGGGKTYEVCAECVIKKGKEREEQK